MFTPLKIWSRLNEFTCRLYYTWKYKIDALIGRDGTANPLFSTRSCNTVSCHVPSDFRRLSQLPPSVFSISISERSACHISLSITLTALISGCSYSTAVHMALITHVFNGIILVFQLLFNMFFCVVILKICNKKIKYEVLWYGRFSASSSCESVQCVPVDSCSWPEEQTKLQLVVLLTWCSAETHLTLSELCVILHSVIITLRHTVC